MFRKSLYTTCSLLCLAFTPLLAHAADVISDELSPRAEVSVKGGTERSILTTEFWAPLAQQSGKVFYGDLRLMGDNDDNREGNLGLGYRQVSGITNSVLGGHIWIDRRHTDNNNTFHQITIGAESLGNVIDLRANGYIALNGSKTAITPNLGSVTPYLAGSGVFIDTNGRITETAQHGTDAEIGYRLPILQHYADAIRIYGGTYDFFGNRTENVFGYRTRISAQVNSAISVGARFQHDNIRGDQGFLEATLRFPFSAKKLYQQKGLYGRLDESPERDVDIVTEAKARSGMMTPFTNASGTAQRILYVDNSNASSIADGTKEHPYTTLQAAQTALQANDILYIAAGNGTTSGMNQGITISQNNVSLIGSGSALTIQGITFLNAGAAPILTNITAADNSSDFAYDHTANVVLITADNALISGITATGAQHAGIEVIADQPGQIINNVTITNNTASNSVFDGGIVIKAANGGIINSALITNNISTRNNGGAGNGVLARAKDNSTINNLTITGNTFYNNNSSGAYLFATGTNALINNIVVNNNTSFANGADGLRTFSTAQGNINNITITNNTTSNNTLNGVYVLATGGTISTINAQNIYAAANGNNGFRAVAENGVINQLNLQNINVTNSGFDGIVLNAFGTGAQITQITGNNLSTNNGRHGLFIDANNGGALNSTSITGVIASGNTQNGVLIYARNKGAVGNISLDSVAAINNTTNGIAEIADGTASTIGTTLLSNISALNNKQNGINVQALNSGAMSNITINTSTANNNLQRGIYVQATGAGSVITTTTVSNSITNGNTQRGIQASIDTAAQADTIRLVNNIANNNTIQGIYLNVTNAGSNLTNAVITGNTTNGNSHTGSVFYSQSGAHLGTLTISGNTSSNNTTVNGLGIQVVSQGSGSSIDTVNASGNTTNSNAAQGLMVQAFSSAAITNTAIINNTSNNNTTSNGYGIELIANGTAYITNSTISGNTATGNSQAGFFIYGDVNSTLSTSLFNNNSTGNATNGMLINRNSTPATFIVDLGGGSLGSTGGNRIFNNTGTEVRIDNYALQAQNNYWGGGNLAGGEQTLNGGSTITTTGFLVTDPRP